MTRHWNTPRDRLISRLEEIRRELTALRFAIPDSLLHGVPDEPWAHSVLDALIQLQRRIDLVTSEECIHSTFYRHFRNLDNSTRGLWGEFTIRVFLQTHMLIPYEAIQHDRMTFSTPFGGRRIDCYVAENKLAVEVKSAYIDGRQRNLVQIRKDSHLLARGDIKTVVWILLGDGSERRKSLLTRAGIEVVLPADSRLQPIHDLFRMITLTEASEAEVLAAIDLLFEAGLRSLIVKQLS
jgi:hypothetical protein